MAVVEAEREPHEMREEAMAHVHLDRERLTAGNQTPRGHQRGAQDPAGDDRADVEPELLGVVEPAARAGRVREWDRHRAVMFEALADALGQALQAEQTPYGQPADGHDQARPDELELPAAPERAELLLTRRRGAVAAAAPGLARIAARDRGAVEGRVELVLAELEPPPQRAAGPAAPRAPLFALDRARRLAEHLSSPARLPP